MIEALPDGMTVDAAIEWRRQRSDRVLNRNDDSTFDRPTGQYLGRERRSVDLVALRYPDPLPSDDELTLRPWTFDDLGCIEEAGTDPRIPGGTTVPAEWSVDEGRAFIERQWGRLESDEGVSLAIHSHARGRAVGLMVMMLRPQPRVTGLGYWVVPSARRRGLARRAVTLASDWALGPGGFARIEAWVEPDNLPSQAVLTAAGFEFEGRLRSFLCIGATRSDALVYSRIAT